VVGSSSPRYLPSRRVYPLKWMRRWRHAQGKHITNTERSHVQHNTDVCIRFRIVLVGKVTTSIHSPMQPYSHQGAVWCREVLSHRKHFQHRQKRGSFHFARSHENSIMYVRSISPIIMLETLMSSTSIRQQRTLASSCMTAKVLRLAQMEPGRR